jgi:hypothetical protein
MLELWLNKRCQFGSINFAEGSISGVLNSAFIAPKVPILGPYSALIARLVRRLLRQSKLILTLIAPNRTESPAAGGISA